ncbi:MULTISPECIES: PspC domain-containing protein [unclassified Granulicatella]|uniref:PspC domain-containing protein n=1 Tax=unclassified Granulicatella TaxID=2630493 RepID=UPI001073F6F7|nr:PspC domain-containing protein [Granulicatella sp. WM01]MBF0780387.1 PspC domain-containing protein [Granulicatella sp. 19428wC4_WM01]TFU95475.1 PspC domain-containing protein [Granulicatella sp. WM01]
MKKLYRSRKDRKIAGVCGGFAEYFGIDSMVVRLIFGVVIAFLVLPTFGTAVILYIVLALAIPNDPFISGDDYFDSPFK